MIQLEKTMLAQPSCEVNIKLGTQNLLLFCLRILKKGAMKWKFQTEIAL